jgi:NAD(P)-dependent dehydrogenase (short-subunit alcohol dehydrogenase family)
MPIALVTGAGSGIGRASAIALAEAGFALVLVGRKIASLEAVRSTIEAAGGVAEARACDITDADAVEALFDGVREQFGRLDLLFNNAGRGARPADPGELSVAAWREVVDLNLTGSFLCTRQAFRLMRAQRPMGGRIINNGSIAAHAPRPLGIAYTATKHAMTGLTKSVALDGRAYNIACGQIDIGNAASEMAQSLATGALQPDGSIRPEPMMRVEEVADAVVFMARLPLSSNVQFMTVMATAMPFIGRG